MKFGESFDDFSIIDIFAGAGGLSLGAARAGFDIRLAIENDKHAALAHKINFPNTIHCSVDALKLSASLILEAANINYGSLTGLVGGPPCQGFSRIGRRDAKDHRNSLFLHFFKLVGNLRPKFYLAENVPGIMDSMYDDLRQEAFSQAPDYVRLEPLNIKASDFGAPTSRTRVFFIGYLKDHFPHGLTSQDFSPSDVIPKVNVGEALTGLPSTIKLSWISDDRAWRKARYPTGGTRYFWDRVTGQIPPNVGDIEAINRLDTENRVSGCIATDHEIKTVNRFSKLRQNEVDPVSRARRLDPSKLCPTIRAGTASDRGSYQAVRPIHPTQPRVITPREAARLQGFPDWFRFAPTKWHAFRQIGNSVSPLAAEALFGVIAKRLRGK